MRPRDDGVNHNRPRRTIAGRVYEKFKPIHEWRREDDHDSLVLYLPGFKKGFLKVTTEDPNILQVRGERLLVGNKWNRFHEYFKVPNTCKMSEIRAKFSGGILTITMPKKIFNAPITTTPPKVQEPMQRTKQDTSSSKPSSSTSNTTLAPQPLPQMNHIDQGKNDLKSLDRVEENGPLNEKITKTSIDTKFSKRTRKVVVAAVVVGIVVLGVYGYYANKTLCKWQYEIAT
ncbi:HSP20-like chaperone [Artemisia annua]|uniref:HSP20-like chaperone n=1 Tax=Artemisia annua TaxID=35608 RepID=A0A2U1M353_ARTAN|nr:HSP20-like chaperone [Artemisia annua]